MKIILRGMGTQKNYTLRRFQNYMESSKYKIQNMCKIPLFK